MRSVLRGLQDPDGVIHLPYNDEWSTRLTICENYVFHKNRWAKFSLLPSNEPHTCLHCVGYMP